MRVNAETFHTLTTHERMSEAYGGLKNQQAHKSTKKKQATKTSNLKNLMSLNSSFYGS